MSIIDLFRIPARIRALLEKHEDWFSRKNELIWKAWVTRKDRDLNDLRKIVLSDKFKPEFRARALYVCLVPASSWLPFAWKSQFAITPRFNRQELKSLSPELQEFLGELVLAFISEVGQVRHNDDRVKAQYELNQLILHLLSLPIDEAVKEELFDKFSIKDFTVWETPDEGSGYNFAQALMRDREVDDAWKYLVENELESVVLDELSGRKLPRSESERASRWYAEIVNSMLGYEELPYSISLLALQVRFMLDRFPKSERIIQSYMMLRILTLLSEGKYDDLRHDIAVAFNSERGEEFFVYSEDTLNAAKLMLKLLTTDDTVSTENLNEKIRGYAKRREAEDRKKEEAEAGERAILAKMMV